MAIRKSIQEELVLSGNREDWLQKCANALEAQGFTKVVKNTTFFQIEADFKQFITYGAIQITLTPAAGSNETKIVAVATSNVDNVFALFKSPNKTILSAFKDGLK